MYGLRQIGQHVRTIAPREAAVASAERQVCECSVVFEPVLFLVFEQVVGPMLDDACDFWILRATDRLDALDDIRRLGAPARAADDRLGEPEFDQRLGETRNQRL